MAVRFVKLSSGNGALIDSATGEVAVIEAAAAAQFQPGPQAPDAWAKGQALVAQGQAVLLTKADLAALTQTTGVMPLLSGSGGWPT